MEHLSPACIAYFEMVMTDAKWPDWYQEMPEFMRGSVENWMLASYLLGIDLARTGCGLTQ